MTIRVLQRDLAAARDHQAILALMKREFTELGFPHFTYLFQVIESFQAAPCVWFSTLSPQWLRHYMDNGYARVDPIMTHYLRATTPLFWSVDDDWSMHGPAVVAYMREVARWGFWGGVGVPIFTKENTRGVVSLCVTAHDADTFDRVAKATFLMRYFHHDILRVWLSDQRVTSGLRARLTPRETAVLIAVGDGLTSQKIADSLLISKRTVETYIKDAQVKLRADNRQQALCKAVNLGLLQPSRSYAAEQINWVT